MERITIPMTSKIAAQVLLRMATKAIIAPNINKTPIPNVRQDAILLPASDQKPMIDIIHEWNNRHQLRHSRTS